MAGLRPPCRCDPRPWSATRGSRGSRLVDCPVGAARRPEPGRALRTAARADVEAALARALDRRVPVLLGESAGLGLEVGDLLEGAGFVRSPGEEALFWAPVAPPPSRRRSRAIDQLPCWSTGSVRCTSRAGRPSRTTSRSATGPTQTLSFASSSSAQGSEADVPRSRTVVCLGLQEGSESQRQRWLSIAGRRPAEKWGPKPARVWRPRQQPAFVISALSH